MRIHNLNFSLAVAFLSIGLLMQNTSVHAQSGNEIYRHITSSDGLSNSFVMDMLQDRNGFIWIAGYAGLDRYDGYSVTSYIHDPANESSLTGGIALSLMEDESGNIWIGTELGLSIFNPADETFLRIRIPDTLPLLRGIRGLMKSRDGFVWAGTANGLYRFSAQTPYLDIPEVEFYGPDDEEDTLPSVNTVEEDSDHMIWLGTAKGLYQFNTETREFHKPGPFEEPLDRLLSSDIWRVFKDSHNNIWISSEGGFAVWRDGEENPEHITTLADGELDLTDQYTVSIFEDESGNLWVGTGFIGAFKYNPVTEEITRFRHEIGNLNSISEDDVHYVFEDSDGNAWFGYHNSGITVMYSQVWQYRFNRLTESDDTAHPMNDIYQVIEDEVGNLWFATGRGLAKLPSDGGPVRNYLPVPEDEAADNNENQLVQIFFTDNQIITVTQAERIYSFDIENESFTPVPVELPENTRLLFNYPVNADETHYYIGIFNDNLLVQIRKEDLELNLIEVPRRDPDSSDSRGVMPLIDSQGNIFVKFVYEKAQDIEWDIYQFHPSAQTLTLLQSAESMPAFGPPVSAGQEGVFWSVTNRGILKEDFINNDYQLLFQRDLGIIPASWTEIYVDKDESLWLGGSSGIVKLDPVTETFTTYEADVNRKPTIFRRANQLGNGDIVYAGAGGYTRFNPDQQSEVPPIQNILISELRAGADRYGTLNSENNYEIDYSNNNISFTYLALNYRNPASTRYRYRLSGYHDEWTDVGSQRSVYLANLPPGNYTFQVQAGPRFGAFSDAIAELQVSILPPWWRTLPAYFLFALILAGGVFTVDRIQRKRLINREREKTREREFAQAKEIEKAYRNLEAAHQELENAHENLKAAQDQLVQQEKLASLGQLTAGIAHEIKNPLNFVNNFSEVSLELIEEAREEVLSAHSDSDSRVSEKSKAKSEKENPFSRLRPDPSGRGDGVAEGDARGVSGEAESEDLPRNAETNLNFANTPLNPSSHRDPFGARGEGNSNTNSALILEILDDIEANLRKIHEHGSRADGIVKSMLQHSRGGSGNMEPIHLNSLIKEYVNLAFHGMRAGKNPITVDIELDLDEQVGEIPLIGEDFSRVILNLCNNAFDAMREKMTGDGGPGAEEKSPLRLRPDFFGEGSGEAKRSRGVSSSLSYHPKLTVRTHQTRSNITIQIDDNGSGIPDEIKEKILQPFFTTKQGAQGTGLGLSITNEIIKAHGGSIDIKSSPGVGSTFCITLTGN